MKQQLQLGLVGLGRMGGNMARRLARGGVAVVGHDPDPRARDALTGEPGVTTVDTLPALTGALRAPRIVWLMVPAGAATDAALEALEGLLEPGDLVVDGGNARHSDSMARGRALAARGLQFADCGVSGGIWGLERGYALMLGADAAAAARLTPLARILAPAPDRGWLHCGPVGAGHFVKMVHNGIEYGMMQALAEGLSLIAHKRELELDVAAVAEMWRHGSVVRSWLLDLTAAALADEGALERVAPVVADSGEGRWAAIEAIELGLPAPRAMAPSRGSAAADRPARRTGRTGYRIRPPRLFRIASRSLTR